MKNRLKILTCLALVFVAMPAGAEVTPNTITLSPFIGGYTFDGTLHLRTRPEYGFRVGYNITPIWGVEGMYSNTPTELTKPQTPPTNDVDTATYGMDILYHFMPKEKLVPFLAIGGRGFYADYPPSIHDKVSGGFDYGGGVKYFINDLIALRGDVRGILLFDQQRSNVEYSVGMTFSWDLRQKAAPPAPRPAPVAAPAPPPEPPQPVAPPPPPPPEPPKVVEPPKPVVLTVQEETINLKIEFDFNKAVIRPEFYANVDAVGEFMKKYPQANLQIDGYTDNVGKKAYNLKLSQRRADAVKKYIVDKFGIDAKRIKAVGHGMTNFIASNKTPEGRYMNRRVTAHHGPVQ